MTIDELKKRWVLSYIHPLLFYLPLKESGNQYCELIVRCKSIFTRYTYYNSFNHNYYTYSVISPFGIGYGVNTKFQILKGNNSYEGKKENEWGSTTREKRKSRRTRDNNYIPSFVCETSEVNWTTNGDETQDFFNDELNEIKFYLPIGDYVFYNYHSEWSQPKGNIDIHLTSENLTTPYVLELEFEPLYCYLEDDDEVIEEKITGVLECIEFEGTRGIYNDWRPIPPILTQEPQISPPVRYWYYKTFPTHLKFNFSSRVIDLSSSVKLNAEHYGDFASESTSIITIGNSVPISIGENNINGLTSGYTIKTKNYFYKFPARVNFSVAAEVFGYSSTYFSVSTIDFNQSLQTNIKNEVSLDWNIMVDRSSQISQTEETEVSLQQLKSRYGEDIYNYNAKDWDTFRDPDKVYFNKYSRAISYFYVSGKVYEYEYSTNEPYYAKSFWGGTYYTMGERKNKTTTTTYDVSSGNCLTNVEIEEIKLWYSGHGVVESGEHFYADKYPLSGYNTSGGTNERNNVTTTVEETNIPIRYKKVPSPLDNSYILDTFVDGIKNIIENDDSLVIDNIKVKLEGNDNKIRIFKQNNNIVGTYNFGTSYSLMDDEGNLNYTIDNQLQLNGGHWYYKIDGENLDIEDIMFLNCADIGEPISAT